MQAQSLCLSSNPTAQEVGAALLPCIFASHREAAERLLHALADSPHWEVREWSGSAAGTVLLNNFQAFYPVIQTWVQDPSDNVRRACLIAVMSLAKSRDPSFSAPCLAIIEDLLPDASPYVAKNLGAFALGSALAAYYPEDVAASLTRWAMDGREQVRWNIAMAFTARAGARLAADAASALAILETDPRPRIQTAMKKVHAAALRYRC